MGFYITLSIVNKISSVLRGLDRNLNPRVPLYTTLQTFAGASGHVYIIKLKILRVPKYTFQNFVGPRHPWHPFYQGPWDTTPWVSGFLTFNLDHSQILSQISYERVDSTPSMGVWIYCPSVYKYSQFYFCNQTMRLGAHFRDLTLS